MKQTYKTELVAIGSLACNGVQAPWRTTGKASMEALKESIVARGLLTPPFVARVRGENILIDGHRRTRACQEIGLKKITCRVVEADSIADAEALFAEIDQRTLKQRGKDRLYGWAHAADRAGYLKAISANQAYQITSFVKIFGEAEASLLASAGTDPSVTSVIQALDRFMRAYGESLPLKTIGKWVLKHKMRGVATAAARTGGKQVAGRVLRCITEDKSLVFRMKAAV